MDQEQTVQTVEGLGELTEKVDSLVQVLEEQNAEPTPEEIQAEQQLEEEQQLVLQQQLDEEIAFREELLLALGDLNTNTLELIEKTESNNTIVSDVAPYAKQASEWVLIAIVVMFLLWIVKQFEDMFNSAFR